MHEKDLNFIGHIVKDDILYVPLKKFNKTLNLPTSYLKFLNSFGTIVDVAQAETSNLHRAICAVDNSTPLKLKEQEMRINHLSKQEEMNIWMGKPLHGRHLNEVNQEYVVNKASNYWLVSGKVFPRQRVSYLPFRIRTKMSLETPTSTTQLPVCFEDMYYQCEVDDINGNLTNHTVSVPHYPSGYTITQIAVASIVVTVLMIVIVVGNMLVIIAISTEKALKNIQNWFIASLAVSDFFLGLIIMPFSLANELMGYWVFGLWWCEVHSAMDVLLSTASIMNLCLISLDRYWSITQAVEYLKKRTPVRAIVMIAAVWVLSALICIPPLLGWKVARPKDEQYPKCQVSDTINRLNYNGILVSSLAIF
ncbi:alpha-2C adrenergic receptor-like [Diabrotica virgifera virgifera]|uniref:G-protein coupled receptors family 1 profile domain-containing protein n=2 Tax=Diabrotica virgifera virgifera TaxID=50390 RepID=A0ABM5KFZ6_DIAVI|nr:alpha-2C adrenergic receptor-like [Diabrotica virgifera virgifera]